MYDMSDSTRPYRGISAENRRTERRATLMQALLDNVGESGVAGVTIEEICRRAGLAKRYFYESFKNRDEILVAGLDELLDQVAALRPAPPEDPAEAESAARRAIESTVQALTEDPRALRLYVEASANPALKLRRDLESKRIAESMVPRGRLRRGDPDPVIVNRMLAAGTTEVLSGWLAGDIKASRERIVTTLTAVALAVASAGLA